jgi:SsrA-binding protein
MGSLQFDFLLPMAPDPKSASKANAPASAKPAGQRISVAQNRRARFEYEILDTFEAGLVLTGSEVKSLREGRANIADAFGIVTNGEIFLLNAHIPPYQMGGDTNHEPTRTRKLLLRHREIDKLIGAVERAGQTLVPLELYFTERGVAKVKLALGRGKKDHDKRESIKEKEAVREIARAMRSRNR